MRIGIVAEGPADVAVIRNILKGKLGMERSDTHVIRPELSEDATDLAERGYRPQREVEFSNWRLVLEECRERTRIETFLVNQIDEERLVVVHLDTAEAHEPGYDIARPDRGADGYCDALRALVVAKLDAYLGPSLAAQVRHAIAVEETDAWVLTLHDKQDKRDTSARLHPKERLKHVMKLGADPAPERYHELTRELRQRKTLDACAKRNRSLRLFVDSL